MNWVLSSKKKGCFLKGLIFSSTKEEDKAYAGIEEDMRSYFSISGIEGKKSRDFLYGGKLIS